MKKYLIIVAAVVAGMAFTSCGSSKETAYRKAYEKAKAQDQAQQTVQQQPMVATQQPVAQQPVAQQPVAQQPAQQPVVEQPVQEQKPVVTPLTEVPANKQTTAQSNVSVRQEKVSVVSGSGLKMYSVVVGSFGVRANAESLMSRLKAAGYDAQVGFNQDRNMYRVIVSTFDTRDAAVQSKQSLQATYPDAWLLLKQ